jgi:hypothetical protein
VVVERAEDFVDRRRPDGSFASAGSIELGESRELVKRLEARLADLPARRRGRAAWYPPEACVLGSIHGLSTGPVRDVIPHAVVER